MVYVIKKAASNEMCANSAVRQQAVNQKIPEVILFSLEITAACTNGNTQNDDS